MKPQPTSRHCFVCGRENPFGLHLKFYESGPQEVRATIAVPEYFQGYPGIVHGGVVAAMLDEVTGRVFMMNDAPDRFMYTAKLSIRYRKPVPVGVELRLVGRPQRDTGRIAFAEGEIRDSQGNLLAEAEAVYVNIPGEALSGVDLETIGWRIETQEKEPQ